MALQFRLIESTLRPLWDYGWFDKSRFRVDGPEEERRDWREVLPSFLQDPISRRTYYQDPDPWGSGTDQHGPYSGWRPGAESYRALSVPELRERVRDILYNPKFSCPPSGEQRKAVDDWLEEHASRQEAGSVLEEPLAPGASWERMVWLIYHEFACYSVERGELTIAVIGLD